MSDFLSQEEVDAIFKGFDLKPTQLSPYQERCLRRAIVHAFYAKQEANFKKDCADLLIDVGFSQSQTQMLINSSVWPAINRELSREQAIYIKVMFDIYRREGFPEDEALTLFINFYKSIRG